METQKEKDKTIFAAVFQSKRYMDAFRGIYLVIATTKHFLVHILTTILVLTLGYFYKISEFEWIALVFSIGFVVVSEAFNTAIEIDIDLTSPEYHPFARDTKDVAAGAVLLSVFTAIIVGLIIFIPKIFMLY